MMLRSFTWALLPVLLGVGAQPAGRPPEGQVSSISLSSAAGTAKLVIAVDKGVSVHQSRMQNPDRLVLDFEPALKGEFASYDGQHRGIVADIRVNQFKPNVVRVVVEFDRMPDYKVEQGPDGSVTVLFADKAFATWNAGTHRVATGAASNAATSSDAAAERATIVSEPEPLFIGVKPKSQQQDTLRFDVNWDKTDINDALNQLALRSGYSIVPGKNVTGTVSMTIRNKTWRQIFEALLAQQGLSATVMAGDIIRVDSPGELGKLDSIERLTQAVIRLNYAKAGEMANNIKGMLTKNRGSAVPDTATNSLILVDTPNRVEAIRAFVESLDLKTPTIAIQAKLVFVDRTNLSQLGVKYDVGTANQFFNKIIQRTDPKTGEPFNPNVDVVNLGGNAVSAISNADALISGSALDLVFSTAIGGFSITSFLSALEQVELTDVEAQPIIHTLDNRQAHDHLRRADAGAHHRRLVVRPGQPGAARERAIQGNRHQADRDAARHRQPADRHGPRCRAFVDPAAGRRRPRLQHPDPARHHQAARQRRRSRRDRRPHRDHRDEEPHRHPAAVVAAVHRQPVQLLDELGTPPGPDHPRDAAHHG